MQIINGIEFHSQIPRTVPELKKRIEPIYSPEKLKGYKKNRLYAIWFELVKQGKLRG